MSHVLRLGLKLATLPAMALPRPIRGGLSEIVRFAVDVAAIVPHAVANGVEKFAEELDESEP